jgi:hypothetical protein
MRTSPVSLAHVSSIDSLAVPQKVIASIVIYWKNSFRGLFLVYSNNQLQAL